MYPMTTTTGSAEAGRLCGTRILVVEDEFIIAMQLQSVFEEEGAHVLGPYSTLAEALEHAASDDITVASLDVNLGQDTATAVATVLNRRQVPFMFYSVATDDPALASWRHVRLIKKPAAASELIDAVAALVRPHTPEPAAPAT